MLKMTNLIKNKLLKKTYSEDIHKDTKDVLYATNQEPVSYTHLDVYKRQAGFSALWGSGFRRHRGQIYPETGPGRGDLVRRLPRRIRLLQRGLWSDGPLAASQLDVYKRQVYWHYQKIFYNI